MKPTFIKFHYKQAPLDLLYLPDDSIMVVESAKQGGTDILTKAGLQYTVLETPDEVASLLNGTVSAGGAA
jgi:hypothetical protein